MNDSLDYVANRIQSKANTAASCNFETAVMTGAAEIVDRIRGMFPADNSAQMCVIRQAQLRFEQAVRPEARRPERAA